MKKVLSLLFAGTFVIACCLALSPVTSASDSKKDTNLVTFSKDVAPIFYKHCADCHRPNDMAPMSLLDVQGRARLGTLDQRESRYAPDASLACGSPLRPHFSNNRSLAQQDIDTIVAWVDQGAKEGNAKDLPASAELSC
jgi:hypothetical protein